MTKYSLSLLIAGLLVGAIGCQDSDVPASAPSTSDTPAQSAEPSPSSTAPGPVAGHYIVVMKDDVPSSGFSKSVSSLATSVNATVEHNYTSSIRGFSARMTAAEADRLRNDPQVKYVEPDYRIQVSTMNVVYNTSGTQVVPWGIKRVGGARDGTGKTAWIVDTGIDIDHPDLNVDLTRSRNFVADGHADADDYNGHGTHVAGIIGAKNNGIDVVGVAPNATLVAVRVLDNDGSGTYSAIIAGLDYVAAGGRAGDVVNMSLGGPASNALDDAVRKVAYRGIKVVIAAGNSTTSATSTSPARVNASNVYTVSAIDQYGRFASFSNYGNPPVDVAAPGVSILSTRMGGGTVYMSGTSMAAPHVAGLLLFGTIHGYGWAGGDPDGYADPIAYR
jgi:subtilisin family serine protease